MGYFEGTSLKEKKAQTIIKKAIKLKTVEEKDIRCLLSEPPTLTVGNFVVCTDVQLIFYETKGLALVHSKYPFSSITAVVMEAEGRLGKYVVITIGGGKSVRLKVVSSESEKLMEFIRKKITISNSTINVPNAVSNADELKKFKELLDMGAISEEEFNAKKRELLNM